jgi:hypothetical protein
MAIWSIIGVIGIGRQSVYNNVGEMAEAQMDMIASIIDSRVKEERTHPDNPFVIYKTENSSNIKYLEDLRQKLREIGLDAVFKGSKDYRYYNKNKQLKFVKDDSGNLRLQAPHLILECWDVTSVGDVYIQGQTSIRGILVDQGKINKTQQGEFEKLRARLAEENGFKE